MNLLNGLAISDINVIKEEAELTSYRKRLTLISQVESFLRKKWFKLITDRLFFCCCKERITKINLFSCCLTENKSLQVTPNQKNIEHSLYQKNCFIKLCRKIKEYFVERWYVCPCEAYIDENHIEKIKNVLMAEDPQAVTDRLENLESKFYSISDDMKELHNKLNAIQELLAEKHKLVD